MSLRQTVLGIAAALLFALPAGAAEVTDLTGAEPTSKSLIRALEIESDAPVGTTAAVAIMVNFALDSAGLTEQARQTLDALAQALSAPELADQSFVIEGHTDARGGTDYNQRLSEERAATVYGYLVSKGIAAARLSALGHGEGQPMPGSDPMDDRNRRVQILSRLAGESPTDPVTSSEASALEIALDYKVLMKQPDGTFKAVDPSASSFATGDRIYIQFASSLTGIFDAYNLTPAGEVTRLASWTVDGGQDLRLPPAPDVIVFQGEPGTELLVLQYYPCETIRTRALGIEADLLAALPDCAGLAERSFHADRSRDLAIESGDDDGIGAFIVLALDEVADAAATGFALSVTLTHE